MDGLGVGVYRFLGPCTAQQRDNSQGGEGGDVCTERGVCRLTCRNSRRLPREVMGKKGASPCPVDPQKVKQTCGGHHSKGVGDTQAHCTQVHCTPAYKHRGSTPRSSAEAWQLLNWGTGTLRKPKKNYSLRRETFIFQVKPSTTRNAIFFRASVG